MSLKKQCAAKNSTECRTLATDALSIHHELPKKENGLRVRQPRN